MPKLIDIKPFQETLHASMCGPAVIAMMLDYYGIQKTEEEVAKLTGTSKELGTSDTDIKKALESFGLIGEIQNEASFDDIRRWLDKKVPVIVDWFTRGRSDYDDFQVADGHYSIVVGLDAQNIYLQDPETGGLRTLDRDDFIRVWFDFKSDHIMSWDDMIIRQLIAVYKK